MDQQNENKWMNEWISPSVTGTVCMGGNAYG